MGASGRQKLLEAILYFAKNTKGCGKLKLFKLLYLLDFGHYKETGRNVTQLEYQAWEKGPVPRALYSEWLDPEKDLEQAVEVKSEVVFTRKRERVSPLRDPNEAVFTPRERRILRSLAEQYRDAMTEDMIKATHDEGGPWHSTWNDGSGKNCLIPYDLALIGADPELLAAIEEHSTFDKSSVVRA